MRMVSIVLPCYNHGEYVKEAIESVLTQTYTDFELFVFDNGSTDGSWKVIQEIEDNRMIKIRLEKNDILEVKKQFICRASGRYFAIMHSDDVWKKEKIEKQIKFLKENKDARLCFTWSEYVDEWLNPIKGFEDYFKEYNKTEKEWWETFFTRYNHLSCPSFLCEREIYIKHFGKLYPYRQIADFYCWMKILEETNLYIVEEFLVKQRNHHHGENQNESSRTHKNISREAHELKYIFYDIIDKMDDESFVRYFCDGEDRYPSLSHLDVICKKLFFFIKRSETYANEYDNVIRYYNTYFDYEEKGLIFYQYLDNKYGFSRSDFFEYESIESGAVKKLRSRISRWTKLENIDFSTIKYPASISIYGCGQIGKIFCKKIMPYCHIEQFIDKKPKIAMYENVPVVTLDQAKINEDSVIVVIPTYDLETIIEDIKKANGHIADENIIDFDAFIDTGRILDIDF